MLRKCNAMKNKNEDLVLRPKRPKGEDGYKTFSIGVKEEIVAKIEEV